MILQLPLELVELVMLNLSYDDINNIGVCCKLLNEVVNRQTFWEKVAQKDFGVNLTSTKKLCVSSSEDVVERNRSAKIFYKEILLPYGNALKEIWQQANFEYYGGMYKLLYHDYMLYLVRLDPPPYPSVNKLLQPQIICQIYVSPNSNKTVANYLEDVPINPTEDQSKQNFANAIYSLKMVKSYTVSGEHRLSMVLSSDSRPQIMDTDHRWQLVPDDESKEEELSRRLGIQRDMARLRFRLQMQYILEGHQLFQQMPIDHFNDPKLCPIKPGIFKATYGSHGIELLRVDYSKDAKKLVGWKITGDPNVPFGETSFIGYLDKPIGSHNLTDDEGLDYFVKLRHSFDKTMTENSDGKRALMEDPSPQPFELPESFCLKDSLLLNDLKTYKWRFASQVQIAKAMFQEPKYVDAHIIIFSENTLAVINIDLKSLKICHRVVESLDGVVNYEEFLESQPL